MTSCAYRGLSRATWRPAIATALTVALTACSSLDVGQARTCRSVIPALNPDRAVIGIERTVALPRGEGVRIHYRTTVPGEPPHERYLECRFAQGGLASQNPGLLVGLRTESGPMGELRLRLLRRFWLEAEGMAADPEPVPGASLVLEVPHALAVGLQHLVFALPPIAIYALLAAAYSLIYGLVGRINLAFGELAAASGYAAFLGVVIAGSTLGVGVALAIALMLALGAAIAYGIASGRFVFAPLMAQTGQRVLIGTIGLALVLQEGLRLAQGSRLKWVPPMLNAPRALARAGDFVVTVTPMALIAAGLCLSAVMALLALMRWSRFGRAWRACADDPSAAELFGVDPGRVLLATFTLASVSAGLAGYVITVYYGTLGYAGGIVLGLKALLAAVAGGIGSVGGAMLGGLLLGSAEAIWSALFPIEMRDLAIFVLLVVLLVVRPRGLLGLAAPPAPYQRR
jgi:branched-chain amino acid transport system permease protein